LPTPLVIENVQPPRPVNRVIALLAVSVLINYIDRGNLSIAAPFLKSELDLSFSQIGMLMGSFFLTYSLFLPVSGWLADRFEVKWVMALGFFLWSGATAIIGGAHAFWALLVARLVLGIGESVAYPCNGKFMALYVPEVGRGLANALIAAGVGCGPALGAIFGALLMGKYGWRPFFIILGLASMVWLIPWFVWAPHGGTSISSAEKNRVGFRELLRQRSMWGTCGGLFGANYVLYFEITWLPTYLTHERHLSVMTMGKISAVGYLCYAAAAVLCGWLSDRWIGTGATPTLVRKTFTGVGAGGAGILLLGCALTEPTISVILLLLAFAAGGMCGSNIWAITQTLAGPKMAGRWTGLQNFLGNYAGVVVSTLTGFVVQYTGHFILAFVIMAAVGLLATLSYVLLIGPVQEIAWEEISVNTLAERSS